MSPRSIGAPHSRFFFRAAYTRRQWPQRLEMVLAYCGCSIREVQTPFFHVKYGGEHRVPPRQVSVSLVPQKKRNYIFISFGNGTPTNKVLSRLIHSHIYMIWICRAVKWGRNSGDTFHLSLCDLLLDQFQLYSSGIVAERIITKYFARMPNSK